MENIQMDHAFDLYAQIISFNLQMQGPFDKLSIEALSQMAKILFSQQQTSSIMKSQDNITMIIDFQRRALEISHGLFGLDHSETCK